MDSALKTLAETIVEFVEAERAEFRLYPELWVDRLVVRLDEHWEEKRQETRLRTQQRVERLKREAQLDPHVELDQLRTAVGAFIDNRFTRATNRVRYGVPDPSGGSGEQPLTVAQYLKVPKS